MEIKKKVKGYQIIDNGQVITGFNKLEDAEKYLADNKSNVSPSKKNKKEKSEILDAEGTGWSSDSEE